MTVAPPAPEPPDWGGPGEVDTSGWQTFTTPDGAASFQLPPSWDVRDVQPFSPGASDGSAHVYTDDGEHLLGLHLRDDAFGFACDSPPVESRVLHAEPADPLLEAAQSGQIATEVRFDARGATGVVWVGLVDGWTPGGGCSHDTWIDVVPGPKGIEAVAFGSGGPGPSLSSAPSFAGFSSASRAIQLIDAERLAAARTIVLSLEVAP
jgi:hypothetical protein